MPQCWQTQTSLTPDEWLSCFEKKNIYIYGSQKKIGSGTRSLWQIGPLRYTGNTQRFCLFSKLNCKAEAHEMFTLKHPPPSKPTISQIHPQKERESFKVYSEPHIHFQDHYSSWISQVRDDGGRGKQSKGMPTCFWSLQVLTAEPRSNFFNGNHEQSVLPKWFWLTGPC